MGPAAELGPGRTGQRSRGGHLQRAGLHGQPAEHPADRARADPAPGRHPARGAGAHYELGRPVAAAYRTGWPAPRSAFLTWPMRSVPKWNTLAARTASAPASTAGAKCASVPAPPLAITGTVTAARTARISSRSNPMVVPSASIEFSRISPAPS